LLHMVVAVDGSRRTPGARRIALLAEQVRQEVRGFGTPLGAEVDLQAFLVARQLDAVFAQVARYRTGDHLLGRGGFDEERNLQVIECRLRDAVRYPDVPGDAGGVGAIENGLAERSARGRIR